MAKPKCPNFLREVPGGVTAPCGFTAFGVRCGIKRRGSDLALIYSVSPAASAGVFTTNCFQAAPVLVTKQRVGRADTQAIVVNSGNANACTGDQGYRDALAMAELAASAVGIPARSALVCSTGIIGRTLPMDKISEGIQKCAASLHPEGGEKAAKAILTTDKRPKSISVEFDLDGRPVRVGGMAKGAGMIGPSMATMLSFITTDADLTPALLQSCLATAADRTFNRILVDGDTSTNDTVLLLANRQAEAGKVTRRHGLSRFGTALEYVASCLAYEIVRDGEGASKLIEIRVRNAASEKDALKIGRTIAGSPLVKTALGGGDPNWGRILAAAGRSGVRFRPELVDLILGGVEVVRGGAACDFNEKKAAASVAASEIQVTLDLNAGKEEATVLTCDLTAAYVRLNSLYHT